MSSPKSRGQRSRILVLPIALAATLLPLLPASAALPPYHQRIRELQAILGSGDVQAKLMEQEIDALEWVAHDLYRVTAGPCALEVRIVNDTSVEREPGWAGPRQFLLEVGDAACE